MDKLFAGLTSFGSSSQDSIPAISTPPGLPPSTAEKQATGWSFGAKPSMTGTTATSPSAVGGSLLDGGLMFDSLVPASSTAMSVQRTAVSSSSMADIMSSSTAGFMQPKTNLTTQFPSHVNTNTMQLQSLETLQPVQKNESFNKRNEAGGLADRLEPSKSQSLLSNQSSTPSFTTGFGHMTGAAPLHPVSVASNQLQVSNQAAPSGPPVSGQLMTSGRSLDPIMPQATLHPTMSTMSSSVNQMFNVSRMVPPTATQSRNFGQFQGSSAPSASSTAFDQATIFPNQLEAKKQEPVIQQPLSTLSATNVNTQSKQPPNFLGGNPHQNPSLVSPHRQQTPYRQPTQSFYRSTDMARSQQQNVESTTNMRTSVGLSFGQQPTSTALIQPQPLQPSRMGQNLVGLQSQPVAFQGSSQLPSQPSSSGFSQSMSTIGQLHPSQPSSSGFTQSMDGIGMLQPTVAQQPTGQSMYFGLPNPVSKPASMPQTQWGLGGSTSSMGPSSTSSINWSQPQNSQSMGLQSFSSGLGHQMQPQQSNQPFGFQPQEIFQPMPSAANPNYSQYHMSAPLQPHPGDNPFG